jgi:hypothetical protein
MEMWFLQKYTLLHYFVFVVPMETNDKPTNDLDERCNQSSQYIDYTQEILAYLFSRQSVTKSHQNHNTNLGIHELKFVFLVPNMPIPTDSKTLAYHDNKFPFENM